MSVQTQIDALLAPSVGLPGLAGDRAMLDAALRFGSDGGKRFRPWLFHTCHQYLTAARGQDSGRRAAHADVLDRVAAAIELLHTAFVVHDDVIDNDDTRRGRSSVPGWFAVAAPLGADGEGERTYARAGGILAGDLALVAAVRAIATSGAAPDQTTRLLDLFDEALQDSAAGELADVRLSLDVEVPGIEEATSVSELKTAAYSFVLPMKAAAVLSGAGTDVAALVGEIGRSLGIAFQLRDDLWGAFGDAHETGKDPLGDLREGKRTPLIAHAATTRHWWRIQAILGRPDLTAAEGEQIRRTLVAAGSVAYVESMMTRHLDHARHIARALGLEAVIDDLPCTWDTPQVGSAPSIEGADVA